VVVKYMALIDEVFIVNFLGNFKNWLDPLWLKQVLNSRGAGRPKEGQTPNSKRMEEEYARAREAGYSEDAIYFWMFDKDNVNFDIPQPPFIDGKFHWWITKMMPGNFMPMHVDPHTTYQKNSQRYWIPLQDWEPGHIFIYENSMMADYKAGDIWMYTDSKNCYSWWWHSGMVLSRISY